MLGKHKRIFYIFQFICTIFHCLVIFIIKTRDFLFQYLLNIWKYIYVAEFCNILANMHIYTALIKMKSPQGRITLQSNQQPNIWDLNFCRAGISDYIYFSLNKYRISFQFGFVNISFHFATTQRIKSNFNFTYL